ncbi:AMP-binding protein [Nonomuraea turcica]|uniref:AMP-binding protein n=1 Tax=Nonomuraea sp. G32 TaxID=3067274 RepID=UPI00273C0E1A|nr:AMP-binding protein [Nonomuraea sp. G32]MDP4500500.1 AMP-binding protein [Nonomuraea sp. G32]
MERLRYVHPHTNGSTRELTGAHLSQLVPVAGACLQRLVEPPEDAPDEDRLVCLVIRDPLRFITGFFAVIQAGMVPVPAPSRPYAHRGHHQRLLSILTASNPAALLTDEPEMSAIPFFDRPVLLVDALLGEQGRTLLPADHVERSTAYVQYTSGSIAAPKPVALRHEHVLAQLAQAAEAYEDSSDNVSVNWVPLYHDMGLVTSVLRPLWSGHVSVLLDPFDFVKDPALWPQAMTRWRATHTSAPDFGYALCARKVSDVRPFDLSPLRVARSAGEPVRGSTMRAFTDRFQPAGFDRRAFKPSYGLAEATLTVTTCRPGESFRTLWVSAERLRQGHVVPVQSTEGATEVTSCGRPLQGTRVEVIDPDTGRPLAADRVGEIWIAGPQVRPSADGAHEIDRTPGHRTGDMGFWHESELYLIGRAKERFQVAGQNFYSVELEVAAGAAHPRLRAGRTAVFLGRLEQWPSPAPVVMAECSDADELDEHTGAEIVRSIIAALGHDAGISAHCVLLVLAGTLPVTTSGKIQRERCRVMFEDNTVKPVYRYQRGHH